MTATPAIAAVILAAGLSRRMGPTNKLTAPLADGPVLARAVRAATQSLARPVVVVTGHDHPAVAAILADFDVTIVHNPQFAEGMASSIRAGVAALPAQCDGALICLGDMPQVTAAHLNALIAAYDPASAPVCAPVFGQKRGNPVLWGRRFFTELGALSGDVGARHMLKAHADLVSSVAMTDDGVLTDLDTPDDIARETQQP